MNEFINKEILTYLPYPSLFERLEAYKLLDDKESPKAKELLDLPCILYILNLPEFELFKSKSLKSKDLWLDVKKFVREELPRINYYYEGGIYLYLKDGKIDDTPLSSELKPSSSFGLQFKKDRETGEEYLLLTKIIRRTDSPSELHPDSKERKQMLEDYKDFFIINKDEVKKTKASTKRLLLFILKDKLHLSQKDIDQWFGYYGFSLYPEYRLVRREINRYKSLFRSSR